MTALPAVERFEASNGARIYRIPMMVFPNGFIAYSYVVLNVGPPMLVDTGSDYGDSSKDLMRGLEAVRDEFGEALRPSDIERILVTHGHVDHFGGVAFMVEQTGAIVGIHELDRRVLTAYEERVIMATKDLRVYLERAGTAPERRQALIDMYGFAKKHVRSVEVDFSLDEDIPFEGMQFFHTPGHCPGQVCILVGNILLSADHILPQTTPHQAPESITHYTGLGHYRDPLRKIEKVDGIELALGGHETPIHNVYDRIWSIYASHDRKLNRVLDIVRSAAKPLSITEITGAMYPDKSGYDELLALEEAGAHVEFLYQHGQLTVANLEQVEREDNPVLLYALSV
jgi:glyoxylase-like metal-dependent hydrolase (beta-lactamase superfamily II)